MKYTYNDDRSNPGITLPRPLTLDEAVAIGKALKLDIKPMTDSDDPTKILPGFYCDGWEDVMIEGTLLSFHPELKNKIFALVTKIED